MATDIVMEEQVDWDSEAYRHQVRMRLLRQIIAGILSAVDQRWFMRVIAWLIFFACCYLKGLIIQFSFSQSYTFLVHLACTFWCINGKAAFSISVHRIIRASRPCTSALWVGMVGVLTIRPRNNFMPTLEAHIYMCLEKKWSDVISSLNFKERLLSQSCACRDSGYLALAHPRHGDTFVPQTHISRSSIPPI